MMLGLPVVMALAQRCAPGIAPEAILSIVSVESKFDPLAINVNGVGGIRATSATQAIDVASRYIRAGYSVDLGLAQINSRNLGWTGLSITSAFDPCSNLAAAEKVLRSGYALASREAGGLDAISRTFSLYNTGSTTAGFRNHYVARVWTAAGAIMPQLTGQTNLPVTDPLASPAGSPLGAAPSFVVTPGNPSVMVFK